MWWVRVVGWLCLLAGCVVLALAVAVAVLSTNAIPLGLPVADMVALLSPSLAHPAELSATITMLVLIALVCFFLGRMMVPGREAEGTEPWLRWPRPAWEQADEDIPPAPLSSLERLRAMSPTEFEHEAGRLLATRGFQHIRIVGQTNDGGVDIEARDKAGHPWLVQCKRYAAGNTVGVGEMRQFGGALAHEFPGHLGLFLTTSGYTRPAQRFARKASIELVNGDRLRRWLAAAGAVVPSGAVVGEATEA